MQAVDPPFPGADAVRGVVLLDAAFGLIDVCLLYTSDAADE